MSPTLQNRNVPTKDCTVSGCSGRMTLRGTQEVASATQGRASGSAWVCDTDPSHVESATGPT